MKKLILMLVVAFATSAVGNAADVVFIGPGSIPPGQVKATIAVSTTGGCNAQLGYSKMAEDQPYFVSSGGAVYAVFPTKDSPRVIAFTKGEYPDYAPTNAWLKATGAQQFVNIPALNAAGYSPFISFFSTKEALVTYEASAEYKVRKTLAEKTKVVELKEADLKAVFALKGADDAETAKMQSEALLKLIPNDLRKAVEKEEKKEEPKKDEPKKDEPKKDIG